MVTENNFTYRIKFVRLKITRNRIWLINSLLMKKKINIFHLEIAFFLSYPILSTQPNNGEGSAKQNRSEQSCACPDETSQLQLFCSTFECIKLYCVPATILPDVAMSDAARVNEPFPGPLAAEYYIDNRNCLPSEQAKTSSSGGRRLYVSRSRTSRSPLFYDYSRKWKVSRSFFRSFFKIKPLFSKNWRGKIIITRINIFFFFFICKEKLWMIVVHGEHSSS